MDLADAKSAKSGLALLHVARADLSLASVRYRGLIPACALQLMGWSTSVRDDAELSSATTFAIAVKPLSDRDARWTTKVCGAGVPLIVDICDNVFVDGYGGQGDKVGRRFQKIARSADVVTVPTAALREVVEREVGGPGLDVLVVPDIVETPSLLARQAALVGVQLPRDMPFRALTARVSCALARRPVLIWFGNHGAVHGTFGLTDLHEFAPALDQAARRYGAELWVVSNHRARFEEVASQLPIRTRYFDWSPTVLDRLLARAHVCLVPNSLDAFSVTKSPNRALKALSAGVPVVATRTPAYEALESCIEFETGSGEAIVRYLGSPELRRAHVSRAREVLERHFSLHALIRALTPVVARARAKAMS